MRFAFIVMLFLYGCAGTSSLSLQKDYCNILDITNWPQGIREGISLFSDQGAWHGFAFIPDSARMTGGFSGPLSMASNYAVGPYTANVLIVIDGELQTTVDAKIEKKYFPGRMIQSFTWETLLGHAEQIHAHGCHDCCRPDHRRHFFLQKDTEHGDKNDI